MPSIKDVAKEAGVSVATVSRVVNKTGVYTKATEELVLNAAKKLDYKPNLFGKALRRGQTKIIMVMLASLANTFCSQVIRAIERSAEKEGYHTIICTTQDIKEKEDYYTNFALNGLFDGLIILNSSLSKNEMADLSSKIPVVQCNEFIDSEKTPFVTIDNYKAAYEATSHLINNGKKRIVFFTAHNDLPSTKFRLKGYRAALCDNKMDFDENLLVYGNYGYRNAVKNFEGFLDKEIPFDSVFAISDRMAAGALSVLTEKEISVPGDVEIIGFDNTDISYISTPQLTTVEQPYDELGRNAFNMLSKVISGEKPQNVILSHKMIYRESTI